MNCKSFEARLSFTGEIVILVIAAFVIHANADDVSTRRIRMQMP